MPLNYNGLSTGITARQQVTIPELTGTDPRNAASVNGALEALANFIQNLQEKAVLTNDATLQTIASALTITGALIGNAGITGNGTGSNPGLTGNGGPTNARGVIGTGTGTGEGVKGTGGGSGGHGVQGIGGASSGNGGHFQGGAPNGTGLFAEGVGTGYGVFAAGGSPAADAIFCEGYMDLTAATAPPSTQYWPNRVTPTSICKAWAYVDLNGAGGATVLSGFGIASVAASVGSLVVTLAGPMASANFCVVVTMGPHSDGTVGKLVAGVQVLSATSFSVTVRDWAAGAAYSLNTNTQRVHFAVFGAQ